MNYKPKLFISIILILVFQSTSFPQTETQPESVKAAYGVLSRTVPQLAEKFHLILIPNKNGNDEFEVKASNGTVTVKGNSAITLTKGAYYYLRHADSSMITWNGSHINSPQTLPDFPDTKISAPYKYRLYYNVCTFGYTTAFWGWKQWEKEIDWMALHGINMPLAMVGQEAILQKVWEGMGITDEQLENYFTGPAFLPWHRMGNVNKHGGPLPQSYIEKSEALQKRILNRMHELGMHPVVPAFSGYVPQALKSIYPDAKIISMKPWAGFPPSNGTYMLSPLSKHFVEIGKKFIQEYQKVYGKNHFYLADAFNEMTVPVTKNGRYKELTSFGRALFKSIHAGDPDGVWVMQGWLFYNDSKFWDKPSVEAFFKDVPDNRMIIIDLANESFHGWKKLNGFFGKEWIYSIIHNYGGHNQWFGNLPLYSSDPIEMLSDTSHGNLVGFGISPEGIDNNEIVYELLTDMEWKNKPVNLNDWISKYCTSRYGAYPAKMKEAWEYLLKTIYSTSNGAPLYFYQFRPSLQKYNEWMDSEDFDKAVGLFLSCSDSLKESGLYKDDAIQLAVQFASNKVDFILNRAIYFYKKNSKVQMTNAFDTAFVLLNKIDELLNDHPLYRLQRWVQLARDWGITPEEKNYYEENAKRQITTWGGPNLSEYAAKEWSGLIKDYYLPRWEKFADSLETGVPYNIYAWEEKWISTPTKNFEEPKINDPIDFAKSLITESSKDCIKFSE
jgi:alpha-N-acetylglucosaminidase